MQFFDYKIPTIWCIIYTIEFYGGSVYIWQIEIVHMMVTGTE